MRELIRVLVVESQLVVRRGLAATFEGEPDIKIVGEAMDGCEAIEKAVLLKPDIVLTEVCLPRLSGLKTISMIKEKLPGVSVLVLTCSEREKDYLTAIKLGVRGYLDKSATFEEIRSALRAVAAGGTVFSPFTARPRHSLS
jgi:DNA-binding NarL/FixJ family response regulator